jgi:uncharacterized protein YxeA
MKTIAITLAAVMTMTGAAYAKPHRQITDAQREDCLATNSDEDGTEWCEKSAKGLTKAQIDAYYKQEGEKAAARYEPGYKNCMREYDDAKRLGEWLGKPNQEDCIAFAEALRQKGIDMTDEGLKGIMETK